MNEEWKFTPSRALKQGSSGKRTARKADNFSPSSGSAVNATTVKSHVGVFWKLIRHQAARHSFPYKLPSCKTKTHEKKEQDRELASTKILLNTRKRSRRLLGHRGDLPAPGTKLWLSQPNRNKRRRNCNLLSPWLKHPANLTATQDTQLLSVTNKNGFEHLQVSTKTNAGNLDQVIGEPANTPTARKSY